MNFTQKILHYPPFGTKIVEKRSAVLRKFDLGHEWSKENGRLKKQNKLMKSQETGMLFAEVCIRQCKPGGRIAIILPNGYLGNRSHKYLVFREWLLRHAKIAAIASFPRFTFKTSGADVSASVVFMEKRVKSVESVSSDKYHFGVAMIERVGWDAGNKRAAPTYKRSPEDGSYIVDDDGNLVVDADFADAIADIRSSAAAADFLWLVDGQPKSEINNGWAVPITRVISDSDLTIDPKRHCRKVAEIIEKYEFVPHVHLGEIVDFLPERKRSTGEVVKLRASNIYQYVEIQDIGYGDFNMTELRGWELPSRARHFAEEGDFYFGSIWGSVAKWCYIGEGYKELVVTNGCHRCRMKNGKEKYLLDLLAFVNTEAWAVQLRALARGSDGLAEITQDDAINVIIPPIDGRASKAIEEFAAKLKKGRTSIRATVSSLIRDHEWNISDCVKRHSHIALV